MFKRRFYLKHLVLSEMQRARIDGRHGDLTRSSSMHSGEQDAAAAANLRSKT
jgi:hypothetical protein